MPHVVTPANLLKDQLFNTGELNPVMLPEEKASCGK
jgi:hypothetical protein